jgi:phosphate/sulfate permease
MMAPLICNSMAGAWQVTGVVKATIKTMISPLIGIQIAMLIIIVILLARVKPEDLRENKNNNNVVGQEIIQNSSIQVVV